MVWIGDETCDGPKKCKWFNFKMGSALGDISIIHSNECIVFFVNIEIFYQSLPQEIVKREITGSKTLQLVNDYRRASFVETCLQVSIRHFVLPILNNY